MVVEGHALGTFAQVKCSPTITSTEVEQIILNIDREAKSSMSIFDQSSLLSKINNNECDSLDRHILINLELAKHYHELSNGYYDVTVKPLTSAWGFAEKSEMVEKPNIDSLIEFVGFDKISIDDGRIIKSDSRIQIDLNSIAKGYIVDLVAEELDKRGVECYMVNIGGEIRCKGTNGEGADFARTILDETLDVYFESFSYAEAARIMKKSPRQFDSLIYRARTSLKTELEKEGITYDEL